LFKAYLCERPERKDHNAYRKCDVGARLRNPEEKRGRAKVTVYFFVQEILTAFHDLEHQPRTIFGAPVFAAPLDVMSYSIGKRCRRGLLSLDFSDLHISRSSI